MRRVWSLVAVAAAGAAAAWLLWRRSAYRRVGESDVDPDARASAESLATRLLSEWRDGRHEPLGDEANERMRESLHPDAQREAYEAVRNEFGDFESVDYVETVAPRNGASLRVYRFRGTFTGATRPEVRVVLDGDGKLSGLWVKPWSASVR